MSQDAEPPENQNDTILQHGWFSVDGSLGGGSYKVEQKDCYGNIISSYTRKYTAWSAGAAYHYKPKINQHLITGLHFMHYSDVTDNDDQFDYRSYGINPYLSYDMRYFGAGLGLSILFQESINSEVLPSAYLRAGPKNILYADFRYMNDFYMSGDPAYFQCSVGSGFGKIDRGSGRIGAYFAESGKNNGFFIAGDVLIKRDVMLKMNAFMGKKLGGSIGLQVHLGQNRWQSQNVKAF
jgi:hypothetical protein